jgi:hypothetical protein
MARAEFCIIPTPQCRRFEVKKKNDLKIEKELAIIIASLTGS